MRHPHMPNNGGFGLDTKMTPMIDVIFQLMIFFLCTAGFANPEAILPTELPSEGAVSTIPAIPKEDTDIVRVQLSGEEDHLVIRMNDQAISSVDALLERLGQVARIASGTPLILDVAPEVAIGSVITIYDGALSAGLSKINFAARRTSP